jgi:capsular polysaccharide biosynthesis protein
MDQEIDLRPIVFALIKNWHILLLGVVLSVVVTVLWYARVPSYKAIVQVAIVKGQTSANFDSGIKRDEVKIDQTLFGSAMSSLATSNAVAQIVVERLGVGLPEELRNPAALIGLMRASIDNRSGLITLSVSYSDPALVLIIANTWTDAFVSQANQVYGTGHDQPVLKAVQQQYMQARQDYGTSEQALADFVANDNITTLEQRIAEYQTVVDNLRAARTRVISDTAAADVVQTTALISSYASLRWSGQAAAISQQNAYQIQKLQTAYTTLGRLEQLRREVIALRDHLAQGGDSASAELALQLLKAQAFAATEDMPANLQIQLPLTGKASVADTESIISTIDTRIEELKAEIARQSAALSDGSATQGSYLNKIEGPRLDPAMQAQFAAILSHNLLLQLLNGDVLTNTTGIALSPDDTIAQVQKHVQQLKAQIQGARAKKFELEQERELAKITYVALGRQISELVTASAADEQVVNVASRAIVATKESFSLSLIKAGAVGVVVLLLLTIIISIRELGGTWLGARQQKQLTGERAQSESRG